MNQLFFQHPIFKSIPSPISSTSTSRKYSESLLLITVTASTPIQLPSFPNETTIMSSLMVYLQPLELLGTRPHSHLRAFYTVIPTVRTLCHQLFHVTCSLISFRTHSAQMPPTLKRLSRLTFLKKFFPLLTTTLSFTLVFVIICP